MKFWIALLLTTVISALPARAQDIVVRGLAVETGSQTPVRGAVVTIRNAKNVIIRNTQTSAKGEFSLTISREKAVGAMLVVSSMAHQVAQCPLNGQDFYRMEMQPKAFEIKDVYVKPDKIIHRNDTTSYLVSAFATQKDRTIGDVLQKLPGINVAKNGAITYNGKAIDQFLVEGVDLFDGQYNVTTRNISHDIISRVDVVENFQSKKTLRNSKTEGGTALNLALKDKDKGRWSGNVSAAAGAPNVWETEVFNARLSATSQTSLMAKSNNSGKDIAVENKALTLDELLKRLQTNSPSPFINPALDRPAALDDARTSRGRTHVANIAHVQKVSPTAIVRTKLYYTDERNTAERQYGLTYFLPDTTLTRATTQHTIYNNRALSAALLYKDDRQRSFFSNELKYASSWESDRTATSGDDNNHIKTLSDMHSIENNLQWIRAIGRHHLKLNATNLFRSMPEALEVAADSSRRQDVKRQQFLSSTQLNFTLNTRRWAFELNAESRIQVLSLDSRYRTTPHDTAFNETAHRNFAALILQPSINYKHRGLRATLQIPVSAYHYFGTTAANKLFFSPWLGLNWELSSRWKLGADVSMSMREPQVDEAHTTPMLVDYRTFQQSPISFSSSRRWQQQAFVAYTDYIHMFFARASVAYHTRHNPLLRAKQVNLRGMAYYSTLESPNHSHGLMAFATVSKRLEWLKGTLNMRCNYTNNTSQMLQNGIKTQFKSGSLQASAGVNSNAWQWLDVAYQAEYMVSALQIRAMKTSTQRLKQSLELTLLPTDALNFAFTAEHYANHFNDGTDKHAFFADFSCLYKYRKTDFTLRITNILNQHFYDNATYTNLSSTYNRYTLRGRTLLLGAKVFF